MLRRFLVGLAAIAVFGGGILIAIVVVTSPGPAQTTRPSAWSSEGSPPAAALEVTAAVSSISPDARLRAMTPLPPPVLAPLGEVGPARSVPPKGSWEAIPVAARPSALGAVGAAIGRGLNNLDAELAPCFDELTQARYGRESHSAVRDAEPMDDRGVTILVLEVEVGGGRARIVDAPVETRGGASDGLIACAQRVLRGRTFEVPAAERPERFRLQWSLTP